MSEKGGLPYWVLVPVLGLLLLAFLTLILRPSPEAEAYQKDCEARGGVLVQNAGGYSHGIYTCVKEFK